MLLDTSDWSALWWPAGLSRPRWEKQNHNSDPQYLLYLLRIHLQQRPGASQLEEASVLTGKHFLNFLARGENMKQLRFDQYEDI